MPFLVTPGIRERRDGLWFCLPMDTFEKVIEELYALSVFLVILRIHTDNGVKALASAVNERSDRQLQPAKDDILFRDRERV